MTKSIITGLGVLAAILAIVLGVADVYPLSAAGAVALGFIGFVCTIFFARVGGFTPFFGVDTDAVPAGAEAQDGALTEHTSTRRLISIGGDDDSQALFDERDPEPATVRSGTPIFDDVAVPEAGVIEAKTPLFGEALSERLAEDRETRTISWSKDEANDDATDVGTPGFSDTGFGAEGFGGSEDAASTDPDAEADLDDDIDGAEDASTELGIVAEQDPDWVEAVDDDETTSDDELDDELDEEATLEADEELDADELVADELVANELDVDDELEPDRASETANAESTDDTDIATDDTDDTETATGGPDTDVIDAEVEIEDIDAEKLAASLDALAPADPSEPPVETDYVAEPVVTASTGLAIDSGTELPVVVQSPTSLELHKYTETEIMAVVRTQEGQLVDTLIDEGVLSTDGPLTDKDIRTMVFVAVSSTELIEVLTEGQRDAVALNGGGTHALDP